MVPNQAGKLISELLLDYWEKLLLKDVLIPFLIHDSVVRQDFAQIHFPGWEATPHMTVGIDDL